MNKLWSLWDSMKVTMKILLRPMNYRQVKTDFLGAKKRCHLQYFQKDGSFPCLELLNCQNYHF